MCNTNEETINVYNILVWISEGKRYLGRSRVRGDIILKGVSNK
jgi:hypothetical protein